MPVKNQATLISTQTKLLTKWLRLISLTIYHMLFRSKPPLVRNTAHVTVLTIFRHPPGSQCCPLDVRWLNKRFPNAT